MDKNTAIAEIEAIFKGYSTNKTDDKSHLETLSNGKLYEVFVLANLIEHLKIAGFHITFKGQDLKFKGAAGMIKKSDPHFEVRQKHYFPPDFWIFVDIEFNTVSHRHLGTNDHSQRHELDIVVVNTDQGYPDFDQIALGVECKAVANFDKGLLKEALGVRREMGYLRDPPQDTVLRQAGGSGFKPVSFRPPSEFWVAFTDPAGMKYSQGPNLYGITLKHLAP